MNVRELIEALKEMPQEAKVYHLWDGELRTQVELVYLSRIGDVVTCDFNQVCYDEEARPASAPTAEEDPYWKTQGKN